METLLLYILVQLRSPLCAGLRGLTLDFHIWVLTTPKESVTTSSLQPPVLGIKSMAFGMRGKESTS